jgi:hypothetical protein
VAATGRADVEFLGNIGGFTQISDMIVSAVKRAPWLAPPRSTREAGSATLASTAPAGWSISGDQRSPFGRFSGYEASAWAQSLQPWHRLRPQATSKSLGESTCFAVSTR